MKFRNRKITTLLLCMMLTVAMAVNMTACDGNGQTDNNQISTEVQNAAEAQVEVLGEGATQFLFTVVDKDGNETNFEIHTDKEIVGDALLELELIAGEDGAYGLYVKTVNGITADYDTDQIYWAFYVDGEYAASGVDTTPIEEGKTYTFKVEK